MEYKQLQNTELTISRIGFGAEPLGGIDWGYVDTKLAMSAVAEAVEMGINYFDTANVYGLGRSEELLAKALGHHRHNVVIATKGGINWEQGVGERSKTFRDSSPKHIKEAVNESLRRLRIDTIPLYFVHWPDPKTPIQATMDTLMSLVEVGKIRYIGVSNFSSAQIVEAYNAGKLVAVQMNYNLIERSLEQEGQLLYESLGIGVFAYGPLAQGLLTGKFNSDTQFNKDDRRHRLPHFQQQQLTKNLQIVDQVIGLGDRYKKTPAQIAIKWVLSNPVVSCAIVGAKSPAQVIQNVGASGWDLSINDWQFLNHSMDKVFS